MREERDGDDDCGDMPCPTIVGGAGRGVGDAVEETLVLTRHRMWTISLWATGVVLNQGMGRRPRRPQGHCLGLRLLPGPLSEQQFLRRSENDRLGHEDVS